MRAIEMQVLGIVLVVVGVSVIIVAQILLSLWLKKTRQEAQAQEDSR